MAETVRTLDTLLELLADNVTGDISAQDVRDLLVSLRPNRVSMYLTDPAPVTLTDPEVWVEVDGAAAWQLDVAPPSAAITMPTPGRLLYGGVTTRAFLLVASATLSVAGNNKTLELAAAVDGEPVLSSVAQRKIGSGADGGAVPLVSLVELDPGSYLSVAVRNLTDTSTPTVEVANLSALGVIL